MKCGINSYGIRFSVSVKSFTKVVKYKKIKQNTAALFRTKELVIFRNRNLFKNVIQKKNKTILEYNNKLEISFLLWIKLFKRTFFKINKMYEMKNRHA